MYIFNLIIRGSSLTGIISSKNGFFNAEIGVRVKGYFQLSKWVHFFLLFFYILGLILDYSQPFLRMADLEWKNWWLVSNIASTLKSILIVFVFKCQLLNTKWALIGSCQSKCVYMLWKAWKDLFFAFKIDNTKWWGRVSCFFSTT